MGYKIGLNGVDNAALWFDKVRVPRLNLLNATSYIDENGVFSSKVIILSSMFLLDSFLFIPISDLIRSTINQQDVVSALLF